MIYRNKFYIFAILILLFFFIGYKFKKNAKILDVKNNKYSLKKRGTESPILLLHEVYWIEKENAFVGANYFSKDIIKFDIKGNVIKTYNSNNKDKIESILSLNYENKKFYLMDNQKHKILVINENLELIASFIVRESYETYICGNENNIYSFGNRTKPLNEKNFIGRKFFCNSDNIFISDKNFLPVIHSKNVGSFCIPNYKGKMLKNKIYLFSGYLPYIIVYNIEDDTFKKEKIKFPGFKNPESINFSEFQKKYGDKHYPMRFFCYQPIKIIYLDNYKKWLIQYRIPLQFQKDNKLLTVLFDRKFKFEKKFISNYEILSDFTENEQPKLLVTNYCEWWKDGYPKKSYLNIIDLKKLLEGK